MNSREVKRKVVAISAIWLLFLALWPKFADDARRKRQEHAKGAAWLLRVEAINLFVLCSAGLLGIIGLQTIAVLFILGHMSLGGVYHFVPVRSH